MSPCNLQLTDRTYRALRQAAARSQKTEDQVLLDALQDYLAKTAVANPLLGLFADDPALLDAVTEATLLDREQSQFRLEDEAGG
ncbi:MAG: hypothetical protein IPM39_05490 [Chloroflexi bacterium]|nr:hypothetical protein [Chloroflexota bacterium]